MGVCNRFLAALILGQISNHSSDSGGVSRNGETFSATRVVDIGIRMFTISWYLVVGVLAFFGIYYALASPPMHLLYDVAPPAGPSTIYVPGTVHKQVQHLFDMTYILTRAIPPFRWWLQWLLVSPWLFAFH